MEEKWAVEQKSYKMNRLKTEIEKGKRRGELMGNILRKCKINGGPLASLNELNVFLAKKSKDQKKLF